MVNEEAQRHKQAGNAAYKKKEFLEAIECYQKAIDLDPNEITFYTNMAAVYFEQQDYDKCVSTCDKAIEVGRENRADFKLVAKAMGRKGNALRKSGNLLEAKAAYEKAITEDRTPEFRNALSEIDAEIKSKEEQAYLDPALGEQEKQKGNECFRKGDFPQAVKHYTEAIKRNPEDVKTFSNRAACYTKLMAFNEALGDCEKAIKLDPTFVKAYLRKANVLKYMNQPFKAMMAYEKAMQIDPTCSEAIEGYRQCSMQNQSDPEEARKNALNDPEIQQILGDPAMRVILEQMQNDPAAIQDHLKNPVIAAKFNKLREAGIIQVMQR